MKTITVTVAPNQNSEARLVIPEGFDDSYERPVVLETSNVANRAPCIGDYGDQQAWECQIQDPTACTTLTYQFVPSDQPLNEQVWLAQSNRYTQPTAELVSDIEAAVDCQAPVQDQIRQLIEKAQSHFEYGHGVGRFYDNQQKVPSLCGTTRGSCVDINTYLLAGAHALDIPAQYVAGYWFHPEKTVTLDMHCWLLFKAGNQVIPWDLAHHMKWGVKTLTEGLNPAAGRRVPMSFGRGLGYQTSFGPITISHFSEPVWVLPNGKTEPSKLTIRIDEGPRK